MLVLFIVVANIAIQCYGMRFCEEFPGVALVRLWQAGLVEVMFEIPGVIKIYRRLKDKTPTEDREDKKLDV